jgi:hypothetical protein
MEKINTQLFYEGAINADKQHKKAQEMTELMNTIKRDALRRKNQYKKMVKAGNAGNLQEVKMLFSEMKIWKKYKIL